MQSRRRASGLARPGRAVRPSPMILDRRLLLSGPGDSMDSPAMIAEQAKIDALTPLDTATHVAATSGTWAEVWGDDLPGPGARVQIPCGFTVTVDGVFDSSIAWIHVDGTLEFATDRDTSLTVDTLVISACGCLQVGTPVQPVEADVTARLTFSDTGPIDRTIDPMGLGRGLIVSGCLSLYGAETTSFVPLAVAPRAGDKVLQLADVPINWEVGGRVVVPGVSPDPKKVQDELLTIVAIEGTSVTVDRNLSFNHLLPDGAQVPLAYLDRNVVLSSQNATVPDRRGHVMIRDHVHMDDDSDMAHDHMGMERVVAYAEFAGLGRTRADMLVTDPEVDSAGKLLPPRDATGKPLPTIVSPAGTRNDRGRYSLHFHHTGEDPDHPAIVRGISVVDGLKWGVVNHDSNVVVEDSVSYRVDGAAFATELGTEIGAFRRNLAIRSFGSRNKRQEGQSGADLRQVNVLPLIGGDDLGFQGYGFWMQGPLVQVEGNIAVGHTKEAFSIFTVGLKSGDVIPVGNLPVGAEALATDIRYNKPVSSVPVGWVPFTFTGNTAIGSRIGLGVYNHFASPTSRLYGLTSVIADSRFLNVRTGFIPYYASRMDLRNIRIVNDPAIYPVGLPSDAGTEVYGDSGDITWDNVTIENFRVGIVMPPRGDLVVRGGFFRNTVNIFISNYGASTITLDVGDANFARPTAAMMKVLQTGRNDRHWDIYLATSTSVGLPDVSEPFQRTPRSVILYVDGEPESLYFRESDRSYQFSTADDFESIRLASKLPDSITALTAGELWDEHHLAVNGVIAPPDARQLPGIHGVVSPTAPDPAGPHLTLFSSRYTNQIHGYTLRVYDLKGTKIDLATVDLVPDSWNFVSGTYNSQTVTELIYAKTTPSDLRLTDANYKPIPTPTTITRAKLASGITFLGLVDNIIDKTIYRTVYTQAFRPDQLIVGADGKVHLELTYSDIAGNQVKRPLVLTVV